MNLLNLLAYFIINGHGLAGPLLWIVNVIIILVIALILWQIVKWAAAEFGVPGKIVQLVGILLFLLLILSLFAGCVETTAPDGTTTRRVDSKTVRVLINEGARAYEQYSAPVQSEKPVTSKP